jgi:hypothetical protein
MTAEDFTIHRRAELVVFFRNYWGKRWVHLAMKQFGVTRLQCYRLSNPMVARSKVSNPISSGYPICCKWETWARGLGFVSPLDAWIAKGLSEDEKRVLELVKAKMKTNERVERASVQRFPGASLDPGTLVAAALGN